MNINKIFEDKKYLDQTIKFYIKKNQIKKITKNEELVLAHLEKARHNIEFYKINKYNYKFKDWIIVILYYSLYHCALALTTNKKYQSKNHSATILLLIKEYNLTKKEAKLIEELSINKEDARLYTELKEHRQNASYTTSTKFTQTKIDEYEEKVIDFINKTDELIK
ncbi:MAG: DNA-binding protein [Candidatus Woesearchaeota archaeon]